MSKKVSDEEFIQAIEEKSGSLHNKEIATYLGISEKTFYKRLKRITVEIKSYTDQYAKRKALIVVGHLFAQSKGGNASSSKILLEMAGSYVPAGIGIDTLNLIKNEGVVMLPGKVPVGTPVEGMDKRLTPEQLMERDEVAEAEATEQSEGRDNQEVGDNDK